MNKGNQKKTTKKYLNYICDLVASHHLVKFSNVNLKDNQLLKKYFKGNDMTITSAYSYMIKQLINLGIIIDTDGSFIPKMKTRHYKLDIDRLIELLKENDMLEYLTENDFIKDYYFRDMLDNNFSHTLLNISNPISYNDIKVADEYKRYFEKVDNTYGELRPLKYKRELIPSDVAEDLRDYYRIKINYFYPVYKECLNLINWINNSQSICQYKMPLHIDIASGKTYDICTYTARQYTTYALEKKSIRMARLSKYGLDLEFDLHSAIFAVARLLNNDEFDTDWDIKRIIEPDYDNWDENEKKEYKLLLNRMFFTHSVSQAWTQYTHPYKKGNCSAERFYDYYELVQTLTYGTEPYVYNIFFYESLFELLVVKRMIENGYDVANVYDCFYFNSNQITEDEVKRLIEDVASNFNTYISILS